MDMIYNTFYSVEVFLSDWTNIVALLGGIVSTVASIWIAILLFRAEQHIYEDKNRQCLLSILDEAGMQFSAMTQFSQSLNRVVNGLNWEKICEERDLLPFLLGIYKAKKDFCRNGVNSTLRKFQLYSGLFDEYRSKKISLWRHGKKIYVGDLFRYLNSFKDIMKNCFRIQNDMSRYFPNFFAFFGEETSDVVELFNTMDKCSTQEVFASEMSKKFQSGHTVTPDWEKVKNIYGELKMLAVKYVELFESAKEVMDDFCKKYKTNPSLLFSQVSIARR